MFNEDYPDEVNEFIFHMLETYEDGYWPSYVGLFDDVPEEYQLRGRLYQSGEDALNALAVSGISGISGIFYDTGSAAWFIGVRKDS